MTRDEAREYFRKQGLSYQDITPEDLRLLEIMLNIEFNRQALARAEEAQENPGRAKPQYWKHVNPAKYYKGKYDEEGRLLCAFMTGKGTYFYAREVISFNPDGFIGLAGEADPKNLEPVLVAFIAWCDRLKNKKEAKT